MIENWPLADADWLPMTPPVPEHFAYAVLEKKLLGPAAPLGDGVPRDRWLYINILDVGLTHRVNLVVGESSQWITVEVAIHNGVCTVTKLTEIHQFDSCCGDPQANAQIV
jgi:hypothetical protein